ncbi:MAG: TIGR03617 family F420-dependent LLM class oxidoreductase [Gammaproteobacteria bacterium]|nr:TIGR03617 family F420-dependent LLM class oxidoreductase [Gammaproteobacteria bacterium]
MSKIETSKINTLKIDTSLMFDPVRVGAMAAELEAVGFDGAYTFEGQNDPFISLAAAAMNSQRMELMTSIAVAFARNPMSLAYQANDLQLLSGGRFILGLGTQVKAHIVRRFNMPWSKPAARMREMVRAIKAIWESWETGDRLQFEGEFYRHTLMSPTFSPGANPHGTPKIYIAGVGPLMTQVAAEVGEGLFVHPFHTPESLARVTLPAVQSGLDSAGKQRSDFDIAAQAITVTGLNEEQLAAAEFSARSQIAFYASTPAYLPVLAVHGWEALQLEANRLSKEGKWAEMAALIDDDMLHTFAVIGEPAQVAQKLMQRFDGKVERVSPVIYSADTALLSTLLEEIRALQG